MGTDDGSCSARSVIGYIGASGSSSVVQAVESTIVPPLSIRPAVVSEERQVVQGSDILIRLMPKHPSHILELAKRGAEHRYQELKAELESLAKMFPHLRRHSGGPLSAPVETVKRAIRRRRRRKMTAAARKALSDRMKTFWAAARQKTKKT
jgi:hypothetical protein